MVPDDVVKELTRSMAGLVLTMRGKHMVVDAFDTCGWDPGRTCGRSINHF
jgi:hypothetical protein